VSDRKYLIFLTESIFPQLQDTLIVAVWPSRAGPKGIESLNHYSLYYPMNSKLLNWTSIKEIFTSYYLLKLKKSSHGTILFSKLSTNTWGKEVIYNCLSKNDYGTLVS